MGMRPIVLKLELFANGSETERRYSQQCLMWILECVVNCNRAYLRLHPETPPLYKAGVRYTHEDDTEDWEGIPSIIKHRGGDCEDLGAWRVAELREHGEPAKPYLKFKEVEGFWHYHIQVQRMAKDANGNWRPGKIEDPSAILGMGTMREGKAINKFRMVRSLEY